MSSQPGLAEAWATVSALYASGIIRAVADQLDAEGLNWGGPDHLDGFNAAIARLREVSDETAPDASKLPWNKT